MNPCTWIEKDVLVGLIDFPANGLPCFMIATRRYTLSSFSTGRSVSDRAERWLCRLQELGLIVSDTFHTNRLLTSEGAFFSNTLPLINHTIPFMVLSDISHPIEFYSSRCCIMRYLHTSTYFVDGRHGSYDNELP